MKSAHKSGTVAESLDLLNPAQLSKFSYLVRLRDQLTDTPARLLLHLCFRDRLSAFLRDGEYSRSRKLN